MESMSLKSTYPVLQGGRINSRLKMVSRCISLFFSLSIRSVVTFADPSEEDLGLYAVEMSDDPNLSSSYDFTAEGKLK